MVEKKALKPVAIKYSRPLVILLIAIVAIFFWLYIHFIYENPTIEFNQMLSSSLSTTGVVEKINESQGNEITQQINLVQLGGRNRVEGNQIEAVVGNGVSGVITTKIGTPSTDYSSFTKINSGQRDKEGHLINFAPILGIWGRTSSSSSTGGQLLRDSVLTAVLIGDVSKAQKNQLLTYAHQNNVYKILSVKKQKAGNRLQLNYSVQISLQPYSVILNTFERDLGYTNLSISDSSSLAGQYLKIDVTVDALSRHLVELSYVGESTTESFSSWGIHVPINLPKQSETLAKLEAQIAALTAK